jgi:hypothetical protein
LIFGDELGVLLAAPIDRLSRVEDDLLPLIVEYIPRLGEELGGLEERGEEGIDPGNALVRGGEILGATARGAFG